MKHNRLSLKGLLLVMSVVILAGGLASLAFLWPTNRSHITGPDARQPELTKRLFTIKTSSGIIRPFVLQVARTAKEQRRGLMFARRLPPGAGMIFLWGHPVISTMWMKNTPHRLDMFFIGPGGHIRRIVREAKAESLAPLSSLVPVVATVEVRGGTANLDDIHVGNRFFGDIAP